MRVLLAGLFVGNAAVGCGDDLSNGGDSGAAHAGDTGVPLASDAGWGLGEARTCDAPLPGVSYSDASADFGFDGTWGVSMSVEGAIGLELRDGEWWLWQPRAPLVVEAWSSGADEGLVAPSTDIPQRVVLADLDGDGRSEALLSGEFLDILWAPGTDGWSLQTLIPSSPGAGVRDVLTIDVDGDGDEDIFAMVGVLQGEELVDVHGVFLQNLGGGGFAAPIELRDASGFWGRPFDGLSMDWDADGDLDVYICNDFGQVHGPNGVLLNDGAGGFSPGDPRQADLGLECMGASAADMDGDGLLDLYLTATADHRLLRDTSEGFVDVSAAWGLPHPEPDQMLWGAQLVDFDNDGLVDIFVATSALTRGDADVPRYPAWLIRQTAPGLFEEVGASLGLPQETMSRAVVAHDINDDGVVDVFFGDANRLAWVFLSDGCTANGWIEVAAPPGTVVRVEAGDRVWTSLVSTAPGMGGSIPPVAHIGLGDDTAVDWVIAQIPGVGERRIGPVQSRQRVTWVGDPS